MIDLKISHTFQIMNFLCDKIQPLCLCFCFSTCGLLTCSFLLFSSFLSTGFYFSFFSNRGLMSYLVFFLILISHFRESKLARCIRFILIFWSRGQREADCAKIYEIKSHSSFFKNEIVGFFSSDEFLD